MRIVFGKGLAATGGRNKVIMNVFFFRTKWALLLYMLYVKDWEDTYYCFNYEKDVPDYFRKKHIKYFVCKRGVPSNFIIQKIFMRIIDFFNYLLFIKKLRGYDNLHFFGDDDSILSKPFVKKGFVVVEDGLANYMPENMHHLQSIGLFGHGCKYRVMGFDSAISKVILSGAFIVPKILKRKAIILDVKRIWREKGKEEQNKILRVFNTSSTELRMYKADYVLLTQNYDSYEVKTTKNELTRYTKILKNYPMEKVLIKPHPLSRLNYKKYFSNYLVVPQKIPFELMALYNDYKVLICINSTAAFTIPGDKRVDLYDLEGNLQKRYELNQWQKMSIDNIKMLIPEIHRPPYTLGQFIKRIAYFLLKKFVWHIP